MQPWLWIVIIIICAAIATTLLALATKLKKIKIKEIFKKKPKKEPKKDKKLEEVPPLPPAEPEKPKVQFSENKKQTPIVCKNEQYQPTSDFRTKEPAYSQMAMGGRPRRRPMPRPTMMQDFDDFDSFRRAHGYSLSIKEQIEALSPEMKAILFGKVLDKKDDLF